NARHTGHHVRNARAGGGLLKVRADAPLEVACLAYIQHFSLGVDMPIDARQVGQISQEGFQIECVGHTDIAYPAARLSSPSPALAASDAAGGQWKLPADGTPGVQEVHPPSPADYRQAPCHNRHSVRPARAQECRQPRWRLPW